MSETPLKIYDIEDAAKLLGCGTWKLRQLCKQGDIKYFKIGNRYRFRELSIIEFIEKQEKSLHRK